jgi:serine/threonine protein kinase
MPIKLGDLELLDMVATGGMAEVYRGRLNDRLIAIKKILPQFTREKDLVQMFIEEAKVAQLLTHPNVVRVYDLLVSDSGELFIAMEFADGKDLADVLYAASVKGQRMSAAMAVFIAREVLHSLEYAHTAKDREGRVMSLIHRDISPHNVMVGYDGWVKLTDFGIAKVAFSGHQTMAGVVKGKFGYMSPEQARGKKLDGRSDLYNVGILLYEMVTGERLFTGSSDISTLDRMRSAVVPTLPATLKCPYDLEQVIRKALSKPADERYLDAAAFDLALGEVAARHNLTCSTAETGKLVRDLFGAHRLGEPPPPSRAKVIVVQSATANSLTDHPLAPAPPPPPPPAPPERAKSASVVVGGRGVAPLVESKPAARAVSMAKNKIEDSAGHTEMLDPAEMDLASLRSLAPPPHKEDTGEETREPTGEVFGNAPSKPPLPPPAPPVLKGDDKARRTPSGDKQAPIGTIRSNLPSVASMPAAPPKSGTERGQLENTRYDQPPKPPPSQVDRTRFEEAPAAPPGRKVTGQQPAAPSGMSPVPNPDLWAPSIVTKSSLQALPALPSDRSVVRADVLVDKSTAPERGRAPPPPPPPAPMNSGVIPTSAKLVALPAADEDRPKKGPNPRSVVWSEPSLADESRRSSEPPAANNAAPGKRPMILTSLPRVDPSAVTGDMVALQGTNTKPVPSGPAPSNHTAMFMQEALAAADGLLGSNPSTVPATPAPAMGDSSETDRERKKREALERIKAKKAAQAGGGEAPAAPPPPPAAESPEDEKERKKQEALERIKAKKAAKAAGLPPPEFPEANPAPAAAAPPANESPEDEKERKKREALERIKAKKAAKAAGEDATSDEASISAAPAGEDDAAKKKREALERIKAKKAAKARGEEPAEAAADAPAAAAPAAGGAPDIMPKAADEWRTSADAPASKPHPDRAGKVLDNPLETYDADARPLARRNAWIIGEPGISAVTQKGGRSLIGTVLPGSWGRRAVAAMVLSALGSYLAAAQKPALVAKMLGPLGPTLVAGVSNVPAPPEGSVALTIRSSPPGAKAWLDGEPLEGETPFTVHLPVTAGAHKVMAGKDKQRKEVAFTLEPGVRAASVLVPVMEDGLVDVVTEEENVTVWLDGRPLGKAPQKLEQVGRDRTHHLQLRQMDRVVWDQRLLPDRPATLSVDPQAGLKLTANVIITSHPAAMLSVDGKDLVRLTGPDPVKVPAGKGVVTVSIPAMGLSRTLHVDAGARTRRYHVELGE